MRKIYMPTENELYQMQEVMGGENMYAYLLAKAVEALIVNGLNNPAQGILRNADEDVKNDAEIVRAIGLLYPYEIEHSQLAMNDSKLCLNLLYGTEDRSIYELDNLNRFYDEVNYDPKVVEKTISTLSDKLLDMPRYRFEYRQSPLLESIFSCDQRIFDLGNPAVLMGIEPGYSLKPIIGDDIEATYNRKYKRSHLFQGMEKYCERYRIPSPRYAGHQYEYETDILTDKDENVKRLIRTIYHDKNNLY